MEATLKAHYGDGFDAAYKAALDTQPTERAALNSLATIEGVEKAGIAGRFLNFRANKASKGDYKGQVVSLRFLLLGPDGTPLAVRADRKTIGWVEDSFPEEPAPLTPVAFAPIFQRSELIKGGTTRHIIPEKTKMSLSNGEDVPLQVKSFGQLITETEQNTGRYDPTGIVLGSIVDSNVSTLEDSGRRIVKAFVEDVNGEQLGVNLDDERILQGLFPGATWTDDNDTLSNAMDGMDVLLYGRIFIGIGGETVIGGEVLENDVMSFVVKGTGFILEFENLPDIIQEAVIAGASE